LSGREDVSANYDSLTYELEEPGDKMRVSLSQDNNASGVEAEHSKATGRRW
jgi:hypothetical protein